MAGGDAPVDPFCGFERFAAVRYLLRGQYIWNLKQHVLEPETRAQHRCSSWSRNDVAASYSIEIELVGQVVEVQLEIHVLRNRIRSHQVKRPVGVDEPRVDGVSETAIYKTRPAAEMKTGRKAVGGPHVE